MSEILAKYVLKPKAQSEWTEQVHGVIASVVYRIFE